jgi:uncharacterized protein YukE
MTVLLNHVANSQKGRHMPATGPVTANEINVTLQAQNAVENAVSQIKTIISNVLESGQQLSTTAMVTTAGAKFGSVVGQWAESATDIINVLNWMAEQLGSTAHQLQAGNQQAEEMAAAVPVIGNFGSF